LDPEEFLRSEYPGNQRIRKGDKAPKDPKTPRQWGSAEIYKWISRIYGQSLAEISEISAQTERHSINADWDMMNCRQGNKTAFFGSGKTKEIPFEFMQMIYALSRIRNKGLYRLGRLFECSLKLGLTQICRH